MSDVEQFIAELRTESDTGRFLHLAEPAIADATRPRVTFVGRLRTRAAAVAAAVVVGVGALSGVAYAANGAAPGDALYGLDRALEHVGIGNGGAAERLAEVGVLVQHGHPDTALQHVADLVVDDPGAQAALLAAADRVGPFDDPASHQGVADLLTYLSANVGAVDGSAVAELAGNIKGGHGDGPPAEVPPAQPDGATPGQPDGVPGGPPDGVTPGPPATHGQPHGSKP